MAQNPLWRCSHVCRSRLSQKVFNSNKNGLQRKGIRTGKTEERPSTLVRFAESLPEVSKIALEATGNWYYFYEVLEDKSPEIYLAHPLKTRAIAEARIERLYTKITKDHGKNTARVAVAREMLKIIYYMLRDKRAFIVETE